VVTETKIALYSHAAVFCCPSVYEPFGIINLEAMACETPVVATAVGGIKEIVEDGKTGYLVEFKAQPENPSRPEDPETLARHLAEKINRVALDASLKRRMGQAGRRRVESLFGWKAVARQHLDLYEKIVARSI
jgi:glycosyltransferase involved in cell wall biosynthesis